MFAKMENVLFFHTMKYFAHTLQFLNYNVLTPTLSRQYTVTVCILCQRNQKRKKELFQGL
jgi:hypothetical protein